MEVRLLLAFVLMGAVMFVSQYFFKSQAPPPRRRRPRRPTPAPTTPAAAAEPANDDRSRRRADDAKAEAARRLPGATPQQTLPPLRHRYRPLPRHVQQSGRERAQLAAQEVQRQRQQAAGPGEHRLRPGRFPSRSTFPAARSPRQDVNWTWYTQTPDPDGLGVSYEYSDGHTPSARSSASRRTAISRRSRPKSRSTASRCRT